MDDAIASLAFNYLESWMSCLHTLGLLVQCSQMILSPLTSGLQQLKYVFILDKVAAYFYVES